ncbi:MAG: metal ABC transporter ATP-binding protein [Clostridia bacterium]|nr:metal ABC transporter ATP-binding protein [Clostridia bacterium]
MFSKKCNLCCTKINHFSVTRGNDKILEDVNLHVHCGEVTAIIGPNGAGKSTLLKAILGDIPHTGELEFIDEKDKKSRDATIGYVPQYLDFDRTTPMSVYDLFSVTYSNFPVWLKKEKKVEELAKDALKKVDAENLINKRLGQLSGGELQRVLLSIALTPMPDILLLDEPVSGMDENGMNLFYKTVSNLREKFHLTIILVSHDFESVKKYADRVVLLDRTVKKVGKPKEVFDSKEFEETF